LWKGTTQGSFQQSLVEIGSVVSDWANCNQTLVEWSFDGPLPKMCPVIPTSNQAGRQAKNRKKGDEILIVHCCFSISQNELGLSLQGLV
jgi:hypothetical protein